MVGTVTINYYYNIKRIDVMRILNIYWLQLMSYEFMTVTIKYKLRMS